ncbi:hypothetical protein B0T21DRAFT_294582 [Apiosordaria backusii]|uniref:Uncharacterized protein n=1 Tax=Apiosordaria backusii TaxID=314023 RepID=A0AA40ASK7_9PEZI|nr:hypothetical protein B0T21DRAFT_294582 [Apiosordaria backusii]
MSFKDSLRLVAGKYQRIVLALYYGGEDVGRLFQEMKWALEDHEKRFDKYFPFPHDGTEEARKAEEQMNEFLDTWGLSIEEMNTEDFLTSLMHIFNKDIDPKYHLKDFDSSYISPGGVWKTMETLAPIIEKGIPTEEPHKEESPKVDPPKFPPLHLVTCLGCGGKKQFGTGRPALKRRRGIARLRRQRQRKETLLGSSD